MADTKYDSLNLVGLHEPDTTLETGPDGNKQAREIPGMYSVGVVVGGRFMTLASFKAGNLVDGDNKVSVNDPPPESSDS